ncbi:MAG: SDR family oxidoreductase [Ardenticatenaceae bacterium]|nr:SDR family oxidoreductase [Ardenticatenaceae bacterium]
MKTVVITGVSTGIGYAAAAELGQRGYQVFGSVRRAEDAEHVQAELGANFTPLLFDVTDEARVKTAVAQLTTHLNGQPLTALINNAGISTPGPLAHLTPEALRQQLEVNVVSVLAVTQAFLPLLKSERTPGRIINISSVSGRIVYPFMGAYAASKHALEALSDALRRELYLYGIEVIVIEPGTVRTPIVGKFGEQVAQYAGTDYAPFLAKLQAEVAERERKAMPVERVTAVIRTALETPNPQPRYPVPRKWLTGWLLPRLLPDRWFDRLTINQLEKMRQS